MVAPSKLAYAMALMPDGDVGFLAARLLDPKAEYTQAVDALLAAADAKP